MARVRINVPGSAGVRQMESGGDQAPGTTVQGASGNKEYADPRLVVLAYLIMALGIWLGSVILSRFGPSAPFKLPQGAEEFSLFAVFYLVAQGVERFIEPISHLHFPNFGGSKMDKLAERDQKVAEALQAAAAGGDVQTPANDAANAQADANQIEANTSVIMWAIASVIAICISAALGLKLMEAIGLHAAGWLDVAVTGIAIGSGTKVLHELIGRLQKPPDTGEAGDED